MYAIIEMGGLQWKVTQASTIRVPKITEEPGKAIEIDKVLLFVNKDHVEIGRPLLNTVKVKATVMSHGKAKKVKVFKKKRRKDYKVLKGHRQDYTELHVDAINVVKQPTKKAATEKPTTKTKPTQVEQSPKADQKKETSTAKTAAKKKTTATRPVAKKTVKPKAAVKKDPASAGETNAKNKPEKKEE